MLRQHLVKDLGFQASKVEPYLFFRKIGASTTFLMVYVDDIIVTGSSSDVIDKVVKQLHNKIL